MTWQRLEAVPAMALAGRVETRRPEIRPLAFLFDRSNFRPDREEDEPAIPARRKGQERVLLTLVFALLALAFVLPVSAAGLSDLVRFFAG